MRGNFNMQLQHTSTATRIALVIHLDDVFWLLLYPHRDTATSHDA